MINECVTHFKRSQVKLYLSSVNCKVVVWIDNHICSSVTNVEGPVQLSAQTFVHQPLQHNQHSHVVYFGIRALYSSFAMIQFILNFQMGY